MNFPNNISMKLPTQFKEPNKELKESEREKKITRVQV